MAPGPPPTHTRGGSFVSGNSSAKPTIPLPRRLLFPYLPHSTPIPPLLASTAPGVDALNAELYEFIAFALRAFVNPWWTKISVRDKDFLVEITRVLTTVIRALEQRLLAADLSILVYRDIPLLITQHYRDYRAAHAKLGTAYAAGSTSLPLMFHQLQPHIAVAPDGTLNETYLRQVVENIMKACLPKEDWEAETERTILREILVKVVLGNALPRLTEPWFIQRIILDLLGPPTAPVPHENSMPRAPITFHTVVVFVLSAVQTISGLCLAAIAFTQGAYHTFITVNSSTKPVKDPSRRDISRPSLDTLAEIFTLRTRAASSSILSLLELGTGFSGPFLDRLLPYMLQKHVLTVSLATKIAVTAKKTLFPNGYPGPPPIDPTPEEQVILREQLEIRLATLLPSVIAPVIIGPSREVCQATISATIDPLSSRECNAHLLVLILDVIVLTLFPEMGVGATPGVETAELDGDGSGSASPKDSTSDSL